MDLINTVTTSFVFPTNPWMKVLAGVQVLLVVVNGLNEYTNPTPYSKFASSSSSSKDKTTPAVVTPSRRGMVLLYAPSMITAMCFILLNYNNLATTTMTVYLVWIHFTKHVLESLFLHKYSGGMERNAAVMIGTFYTLVSTLITMTAEPWMNSEDLSSNDNEEQTNTRLLIQQLGLVMFIVGTIGNLYHHYLLRQLRSSPPKSKNSRSRNENNTHDVKYDNDNDKKKQRYAPPPGGLFDYVVAPHYLFEIIAFVGIACTSLSIHSLLVSLGMASYLTGRACRTLKFYQDTFDKLEFSRETKALIPFIL